MLRQPARLVLGGLFCFWAACTPSPTDSSDDPGVTLEVPALSAVSLTCDPDRERWTIEAQATSWTGGGVLWMTVDGDYLEEHFVRSVEAAADGSSDRLFGRIVIVADWRDAAPGTSTAFRCLEDTTQLFVLDDLDREPVDCRIWGADPSLLDREGVPPCEVVLEEA